MLCSISTHPGDPVHAYKGEDQDEDDCDAADDPHVVEPVREVRVHNPRPVGDVLLQSTILVNRILNNLIRILAHYVSC